MTDQPVYVNAEFTPNPNTMKFVVNRSLLPQGAAHFSDAEKAEKSPLAKKVFAIPGVEALLIGTNFITVTKTSDGDWDKIGEEVPSVVKTHIESGDLHVDKDWQWDKATENLSEKDREIETKIREILDKDIRPAVAMDGGDITFHKYDEGLVYLHLRGACASCPGATMTLKMGVESHLKQLIPEVKEVIAV